MQRLLGLRKVADNLDLVEPDIPVDKGNEPDMKRRFRHKMRFRNEPGGMRETDIDGMGGYRNTNRGPGSDQTYDVGSPSSINANGTGVVNPKRKLWIRQKDIDTPIAGDTDHNPQEEKEIMNTQYNEFNQMQQR